MLRHDARTKLSETSSHCRASIQNTSKACSCLSILWSFHTRLCNHTIFESLHCYLLFILHLLLHHHRISTSPCWVGCSLSRSSAERLQDATGPSPFKRSLTVSRGSHAQDPTIHITKPRIAVVQLLASTSTPRLERLFDRAAMHTPWTGSMTLCPFPSAISPNASHSSWQSRFETR